MGLQIFPPRLCPTPATILSRSLRISFRLFFLSILKTISSELQEMVMFPKKYSNIVPMGFIRLRNGQNPHFVMGDPQDYSNGDYVRTLLKRLVVRAYFPTVYHVRIWLSSKSVTFELYQYWTLFLVAVNLPTRNPKYQKITDFVDNRGQNLRNTENREVMFIRWLPKSGPILYALIWYTDISEVPGVRTYFYMETTTKIFWIFCAGNKSSQRNSKRKNTISLE